MKVLILWADRQSANYGVRVLAEGMAALARRAWGPNVEVDFQDYKAGDSPTSFGTRAIARDIGRGSGPIRSRLEEYDLVLDSGAGDSFADIYGLKRLAFMFYASTVSRRLGQPVVLGPQTIGPFDTTVGRWMGRQMIRQAEVVMARDPASASYSKNTLGRAVDLTATDVVFALPVPQCASTGDILLNVSGLLWFPNPHVEHHRYRKEVLSLIDGLEASGRSLRLLAHVVKPGSGADDTAAIDSILDMRDVGVVVPADLDTARRLIASADLVVGSRMHACLNALSVGTPAIAWAYSRKFAPLMGHIGWDHVHDLKKSGVAERTLASLDAVLSARGEVDALRRRAAQRLDAATDLLSEVGATWG